MKAKNENNLTTLDEILDKKYGKRGAKKREQWEQEFETFQLPAAQHVPKRLLRIRH